MDGTKIGVFEKTNEISFGCFLKSHHGRRLESQFRLIFMSDLSHKSLERQLPHKEFS
jgi:hypothetical protein